MTKFETKEQRQKVVDKVQASSALEGYEPLTPNDGVAYKLQQDWIDGKITLKESKKKLMEYYGL